MILARMSLVSGKGKVFLKLTLGKVLTLCDVLHMSNSCCNLVLVSLLGKMGVRIAKIVLIENDVFVVKGYCN